MPGSLTRVSVASMRRESNPEPALFRSLSGCLVRLTPPASFGERSNTKKCADDRRSLRRYLRVSISVEILAAIPGCALE